MGINREERNRVLVVRSEDHWETSGSLRREIEVNKGGGGGESRVRGTSSVQGI